MSSSNLFGRGISTKRIELIMTTYPNILKNYSDDSEPELIELIKQINGFQEKTATCFVKGIPKFLQFTQNCGLVNIVNQHSIQSSSSIQNKENQNKENQNKENQNKENQNKENQNKENQNKENQNKENQNKENQNKENSETKNSNVHNIKLTFIINSLKIKKTNNNELTFLMTGFRNEEIKNNLLQIGFKEIKTPSKKTGLNLVIIKDETYENTKTKKIPEEFPNVVITTQENIKTLLNTSL
jgi:hypothetical protein